MEISRSMIFRRSVENVDTEDSQLLTPSVAVETMQMWVIMKEPIIQLKSRFQPLLLLSKQIFLTTFALLAFITYCTKCHVILICKINKSFYLVVSCNFYKNLLEYNSLINKYLGKKNGLGMLKFLFKLVFSSFFCYKDPRPLPKTNGCAYYLT